jgi:pyrroline-5-carboxylate reductase
MSKILFIGAGNMGQAIINGIITKNIFKKEDISIYEISEITKKSVIDKFGVNECKNLDLSIYDYEMIFFAVKPQVFNDLIFDDKTKKLKDFFNKDQIIISIMAGIPISKIQSFLGQDKNVVRVMPNTPALIGESASAISHSDNIQKEKLDTIVKIFGSIGIVEILDEKYLDAVTALSGSGPAYVFTFIESLVQGGILCGLSKPIAEKLAVQTVLGSVKMIGGNKSIEELRHMVTSPAGTTIEALSVIEKNGFRGIIMEAVSKAYNRAKELGAK